SLTAVSRLFLCGVFFQAEDGIRDSSVTGVQTCALPICFHPVSNWGPFACEANVITTTLWKQITLAFALFVTEEILERGLNLKVVSRQTTALNKRLFPPSFELGTFRLLGE